MRNIRFISIYTALMLFFGCNTLHKETHRAQNSNAIRLNQIGFYPQAPKIAIITDKYSGEFYITKPDSEKVIYTGKTTNSHQVDMSFANTCVANFSEFQKTGKYIIRVPGVGNSIPFEIKENVLADVADASIKAFYFQRASTALTLEYAGKWARPLGHPDTNVLIHASAAGSFRPEGSIISAPYGWYDAGDYNKYIVNAGISTATMLALYEDFPDYFKEKTFNIPESKNNIPDILDEILWNLRWMLKMQDPFDGGVYHKLTTANFGRRVMPHLSVNLRYVVQKGTASTLNFAAVTAQASRILREYNSEFPGLSDSCLAMAEQAWNWAIKNPNMRYNQNEVNKKFKPEIRTGEYGDNQFNDEFFWAAAELYITSQNIKYGDYIIENMKPDIKLQRWNQVRSLGYFSLVRNDNQIPYFSKDDIIYMRSKIKNFADNLMAGEDTTAFLMVMGKTKSDYCWGSNAVAANQGIALINAYWITKDKKYLNSAISNLDYLLGKNPTNYSFVTGFGYKHPMNPHHSQSMSDTVVDPIPGLLVGGPNPGKQDKCYYPFDKPEESYVDVADSYASNEIAINWQAAFAYLVNAVEIIEKNDK